MIGYEDPVSLSLLQMTAASGGGDEVVHGSFITSVSQNDRLRNWQRPNPTTEDFFSWWVEWMGDLATIIAII